MLMTVLSPSEKREKTKVRYICKQPPGKLPAFRIQKQFNSLTIVHQYEMFHSRTLNNRINKLHERALRLVYKNPTLNFEQLLEIDNSFTIHHRNIQKLAIEIYKVINSESPSIMKNVFPLTNNLRSKNPFRTYNVHSVHYSTETISYIGSKIWALVPEKIKQSITLAEFKQRIRSWKPDGCTCRTCKTYIANLGFI